MSIPAAPLFLGGHPALDFLNTAFSPDGTAMEAIGDGRGLLNWLVGAELLRRPDADALLSRHGVRAMDAVAAKARKLREQVRAWLRRWRTSPDRFYRTEIAMLNEVLSEGVWRACLIGGAKGAEALQRLEIEKADDLLPLLAWQVAKLVSQEEASLIKACAGPGCTLWFLDRTKAHRRRFCSAAGCGNRAKVAAFRERHRQG
jgi:predicted RNA-binding Zn ribbon-like protein